MCNFKVLEHNGNGYVVRCEKCRQVQIAFGNVVIKNAEERFITFRNIVADLAEKKKPEYEREARNIYLETPCRNMMLLFTANEIDQLDELLEGAVASIEIDNLIESTK